MAIHTLGAPQTRSALSAAMGSSDARLRAAAIGVLAKLEPDGPATMSTLKAALDGDSIPERQAALAALGGMKSRDATSLLARWVAADALLNRREALDSEDELMQGLGYPELVDEEQKDAIGAPLG